jgi:multidrug transporter EmrE-like cation transporter
MPGNTGVSNRCTLPATQNDLVAKARRSKAPRAPPPMIWILVVATVAGLSVGQVLFKLGAMHLNANAQGGLIAWLNVPIVAAVIIYAVCTVMWIGALRELPLRVAYPVVAVSYLLVPLLGHLFLREPLTARTMVGGLVILVGVIIASSAD